LRRVISWASALLAGGFILAKPTKCGIADCGQEPAASLDNSALCREHFIATCSKRLSQYEEMRKNPGLGVADTEAARRFVHECMRQADEIEHGAEELDEADRDKLLSIILSASELGRHLRRSPRKVAAIAVHLTSQRPGESWEEDTETLLLSRHGALVRCSHAAKPGQTLEMTRSDTGRKVQARVAWQRNPGPEKDGARLGVEFVACENFWELDWSAVEEAADPARAERQI